MLDAGTKVWIVIRLDDGFPQSRRWLLSREVGASALEAVGFIDGRTTGRIVLVVDAVEGDERSCAALRRAILGRCSRGLGQRVGGWRWVVGGLEIAVAEV